MLSGMCLVLDVPIMQVASASAADDPWEPGGTSGCQGSHTTREAHGDGAAVEVEDRIAPHRRSPNPL